MIRVLLTFLLLAPTVATPLIDQSLAEQQEKQQVAAVNLEEATHLDESIVELFKSGKYEQALPLAKRSLEIKQGLLPQSDQRVGVGLINLGEIYFALKKDSDAEKAFRQALTVVEVGQAKDAASVSHLLERLAYLRFRSRDSADATSLLQRSLAIRQEAFGSNDVRLAPTLLELASAYQSLGQHEKAQPLFVQALKIREAVLGRKHPETIEGMKMFACAERGRVRNDQTNKPDIETEALINRAECWLGGFQDDCAELTAKPNEKNGKALRLYQPNYPYQARYSKMSASLTVAVLIDERGKVENARLVCEAPPSIFIAGSLTAARAALFEPTLRDGKPVKVTGIINFNFIAR